MKISATLHTDGGARGNPGPAAVGIVLTLSDGSEKTFHKYIGATTNNEAEYVGLLLGLRLAVQNNVTDLSCFLDSELIVKQLNGLYKVKNENLQKFYVQIQHECTKFSSVSFTHVPRSQNKLADKLVNIALDTVLT